MNSGSVDIRLEIEAPETMLPTLIYHCIPITNTMIEYFLFSGLMKHFVVNQKQNKRS